MRVFFNALTILISIVKFKYLLCFVKAFSTKVAFHHVQLHTCAFRIGVHLDTYSFTVFPIAPQQDKKYISRRKADVNLVGVSTCESRKAFTWDVS